MPLPPSLVYALLTDARGIESIEGCHQACLLPANIEGVGWGRGGMRQGRDAAGEGYGRGVGCGRGGMPVPLNGDLAGKRHNERGPPTR